MRPEEQQQAQQQWNPVTQRWEPIPQWHPEGMPPGLPPNYVPRPLPTGAAAPVPYRRPGSRGRWVAAGAAVLAVVGVVGWLVAGGSGGDVPSTAKSSVASSPSSVDAPPVHVYSGPELIAMWDTAPAVCDNPIGSKDKPADPHGLLRDKWVDRAVVTSMLAGITSPADETFIRKRFWYLDIAMIQTHADMTNAVNQANDDLYTMTPGSPEAQQRIARAKDDIDLDRTSFGWMLNITKSELETGVVSNDPRKDLFPVSGTCP